MDVLFGVYVAFATLFFRPILTLIFHVFNFFPFVKNRLNFERKNFRDPYVDYHGRSLAKIDGKSFGFFVSSEGEFEQVYSLIVEILEHDSKVEIIFTSASVEKKIIAFVDSLSFLDKKKVAILRLPLMTFFPVSFFIFQSPYFWIKSKTLIFCRYDFFPELLFFKFLKRRLILVSATLKNKNLDGVRSLYLNSFYNQFSFIVPATSRDQELISRFSQSKVCLAPFDFRVSRILYRLNRSEETFKERFKLDNFFKLMNKWNYENDEKSLILGSLWPSDLQAVLTKNTIDSYAAHKWSLFIFPHKINDSTFINTIEEVLNRNGSQLKFVVLNNFTELNALSNFERSTIYFFNMAGILVECFQFFTKAYIGGGFERSIHSVLEPYMAGSRVIAGPKVHRSTEWDLINQDKSCLGASMISDDLEFLAVLDDYVAQNRTIRDSKNYKTLIQWNKDKIRELVQTHFL